MKKTKITAAALAAALLTLASCGSKPKVPTGDWTISTINGVSVADYAASAGITEATAYGNYKVGDTSMTINGVNPVGAPADITYAVEAAEGGFSFNASGNKIFVAYDEKAGTLTYEMDGKKYVLTKGTTDLAALFTEAAVTTTDPDDYLFTETTTTTTQWVEILEEDEIIGDDMIVVEDDEELPTAVTAGSEASGITPPETGNDKIAYFEDED